MRQILLIGLIFTASALAACGGGTADSPYDYCVAGTPPDAQCWMEKRDNTSENMQMAMDLGDRVITEMAPQERTREWTDAVLMVGMWELYRATGTQDYLDYIQAWMDHHIEEGIVIGTSDTCAMAALAVRLYDITGEARYKAVVEDALDYLHHRALRTEAGGISHWGDMDVLGVGIWVDSLFMFGNVLTSLGETTGDADLMEEYAEQFRIFTDTLQKSIGFYKHAEGTIFEQDDNVYWGRGNGWVLAAGYDHLRVRLGLGLAQPPAMQEALETLAAAARQYQDADTGLYWTVLNRPGETYLETSAAGLFGLGMARAWRNGFLGDEVLTSIALSVKGLKSRIEYRDGVPYVTGVSAGTNVGDFDYYASIRQFDTIPYGYGIAIMLLCETAGLPLPTP